MGQDSESKRGEGRGRAETSADREYRRQQGVRVPEGAPVDLSGLPPSHPVIIAGSSQEVTDALLAAVLVVREHIESCKAALASADPAVRVKAQARFGDREAWKHYASQAVLDLRARLLLLDKETD